MVKARLLLPLAVGVVLVLVASMLFMLNNTYAAPFPYAVGGTGSSTVPAVSQIFYAGPTAWQSEATGTITCTGTASCGAGSYVLGSNLTINATSGGGSSVFASSSAFTAGQIPYATNTNGTPINFSAVSTSTATISNGLTYSGTWGNEIGGASGTLTCTTGSATIFGCLTAANFNVFNNKIGTSSALTNGQLLVAGPNGNTAYSIATTTLSGSGLISVTAGAVTVGASPITVSCASCSSTTGTVTSITGGTGLSGGAITTSGTLALLSYLATSSAETATRIPVWASTNGTPATLGGGFSGYTLASALLTATNASTTNLTAGTYFQAPNQSTNPTNTFAGSIVINTNGQASSSIAIGDGTNTNMVFAEHSFSVTFASSTLTYYGSFGAAGTTTTLVANPIHSSTLLSAYCKTDQGTAYLVFGNGTASTTAFQCTASGAQSTISSNNAWKGRQPVLINLGDSASAPNLITVTADVEDSN